MLTTPSTPIVLTFYFPSTLCNLPFPSGVLFLTIMITLEYTGIPPLCYCTNSLSPHNVYQMTHLNSRTLFDYFAVQILNLSALMSD